MDRRTFLAGTGAGLLAAPLAVEAQQVHRIGVLLFSTPTTDPQIEAFRRGLRELGYVEGRNVTFDYGFADGHPERLPQLAVELVSRRPDLIFALGGDVDACRRGLRALGPSVTRRGQGLSPSPVSSICPHSHHKSPATLAQSSDRVTHHLMSTSDREKTLKERIGHRLETQVTRSSWLLHSRDVGSTRFACMPHRCAFGSTWRFKKASIAAARTKVWVLV